MKKIIALTLMCHLSSSAVHEICAFISPHSQSVDAARELAGWENKVNIYTEENWYSVFSITPEATLTFRPERVAQCLFGDMVIDYNNSFKIMGSQTNNRTPAAWLADYFGLPTDYQSTVHFEPYVLNLLTDFDYYCGWNTYVPGLYARIHAPLVYAQTDLGFCETLITTGSNAYDPGYFNADGIPRAQLASTFSSFISGSDAPTAPDLTFNKLSNAKIPRHPQHVVLLSEIQVAIGYNVLNARRYHLGGNFRFSIPTGNRPNGEYLFEPIVGNGHHWEVGGGLSTHIILWEDKDLDDKAGLYLDANFTHIFKSYQCRSFDLCNKPNSRYMLAQLMNPSVENNLRGLVDGADILPSAQYASEVTTVANLTTLPIYVGNNVQVDLALLLAYTKGKNSWTFGYGFWSRSCDSIDRPPITSLDVQTWALKGDSYAFGFENTAEQTPIALSSTESNATVYSGTNFNKNGVTNPADIAQDQTNPGIDNPAFAQSDSANSGTFTNLQSQPGGPYQIRTSIQPALLSSRSIDWQSARSRGISNKIVSSFNHTIELRTIIPYIGFGAEMEFGQHAACNPYNTNRPCINSALSLWAVWLKGGASF